MSVKKCKQVYTVFGSGPAVFIRDLQVEEIIMPVSMTKNQKSRVQLEHMMQQACPNSPDKILNELTEGYFNAAYEVTLQNGKQVILKIAPPPDVSVMRYEKDLMAAEGGAMRLVAEQTDCHEVLFIPHDRYIRRRCNF